MAPALEEQRGFVMRVIASCLVVLAASSAAAAPITDPRQLVSEAGATTSRVEPAQLSELTVLANPVWSPDGQSVAYISSESGTFKIHIRELTTGRSRQPAQTAGEQSAAKWSPDGSRLLFIADNDGDEMYDMAMRCTTFMSSS
jgi:dipeptidyl aminopeptidase/acylaminoacyl peptidase